MYFCCWVPSWLKTGHETPACNCRCSLDIFNIFPTSSFCQIWEMTIFVFITPCSVSKLKILNPPRCMGSCRTAMVVMQLMPMCERNVGKYLCWIFWHCWEVKHVAPSGYWIIALQMEWNPILVCSRLRGALLKHCLIVNACWIWYCNFSLSLPLGANHTLRVCMPFIGSIHWIVWYVVRLSPAVSLISRSSSTFMSFILHLPLALNVHPIPYQKHFAWLSAPPIAYSNHSHLWADSCISWW